MDKMGFSWCVLLALLAAQACWCRPQQRGKLRQVTLITEPRPGQEFVHIKSSVLTQEKKFSADAPEVDFATSHKIPGALPADDADDDEELDEEPEVSLKSHVRTPSGQVKIKRESVEAEKIVEQAILALSEPKKSEEVRMEFSVVTSKPRKETKTSGASKKVSAASDGHVTTPLVEVDSKGESGQLEANPSGADEKKVLAMKKQPGGVKQAASAEEEQLEVEVKPASQVGVNTPVVEQASGAITVPAQKHTSDVSTAGTTTPLPSITPGETFELVPVNHIAEKREDSDKEKDFDFVDTPLADKVLVPAGTNQQSRIEVKKGPNGQDYEYEYVYYYYDDEDDDNSTATNKKNTVQTSTSVSTTSAAPSTTSSRQYLPESPAAQEVADNSRVRGRGRGQAAQVDVESSVVAQDVVNEVVPARGGAQSRSRGRSGTTEEPSTVAADERLPANTRFPPRSRSSHNSNSVATTTPLPVQDTPVTRVRGSVRRPSLELVDSSSFKTHSSDASRDQDLRPEFPSRLPEGPARFLGVAANEEEEAVKPRGNRLRGQSPPAVVEDVVEVEEEDEDVSDAPRRGQPIRRPASTVEEATTQEAGLSAAQMDLVANELYSLYQQAQAENAIDAVSDAAAVDDEITTELEEVTTTPAPTTTTSTTTTPAPTTTTSTTTQEPSTAGGRGRYRQRGNAPATGNRNRFRGNSIDVASTTTEAAVVESSTRARGRFGSNSRVPSSNNYGRKGFQKSTASPVDDHSGDSEPEVHSTSAPVTRSSGFSRNRFSAAARSTRVTSTTSSPPSDDSPVSSPPSPAKPAFADRFNHLRRRGGAKASTTSAPVAEETRSDSSGEETNEPTHTSEATTTTARPAGRTRLSIGSGARPLRPGPKVNIGGRGRLGATTSTTTQQPSTEAEDSEQTPSSSSSAQEDAQSQSDEAAEVVTTPVPDALTRLRNRPRLRVNAAKQHASTTASPPRRAHGLLPRRRLQPQEAKDTSDSESTHTSEESESSSSSEETSEASTEGTSTHEPAQDTPRGSPLLGGRRTRPRAHFPSRARASHDDNN